jgi:hypothetical protein
MTQERFPHGRIAMGNGDLDAVNIKYDLTNNAKKVATLRRACAGFVKGVVDTNVTFDVVVGENGEEADWVKLVQKMIFQQIRIKIPGRTIAVDGVYTTYSLDSPLDSEIKGSCTFIGATVEDS